MQDVHGSVHPLVGFWGGLGIGVMKQNAYGHGHQTNPLKRMLDHDLDLYSVNGDFFCLSFNNWQWFVILECLSPDMPLTKLSPFAIQKGISAVAGTVKNARKGLCPNSGGSISWHWQHLYMKRPQPAENILIDYQRVPVDLYIPNLLRCSNYQKFAHGSASKIKAICCNCGEEGHEYICKKTP